MPRLPKAANVFPPNRTTIGGVPCVQMELKTLGANPHRAMEQIHSSKSDLGNDYTRMLLCFFQLFIVSNRNQTFYFVNNNARYIGFQLA